MIYTTANKYHIKYTAKMFQAVTHLRQETDWQLRVAYRKGVFSGRKGRIQWVQGAYSVGARGAPKLSKDNFVSFLQLPSAVNRLWCLTHMCFKIL